MGNDRLLFSASLQPARHAAQGNFQSQVYVVNVDGSSRPVLYSSIPATAMSVAADGRVLYQDRKGYENLMRKHERSSGTADVWMVSDGKYTRLTMQLIRFRCTGRQCIDLTIPAECQNAIGRCRQRAHRITPCRTG